MYCLVKTIGKGVCTVYLIIYVICIVKIGDKTGDRNVENIKVFCAGCSNFPFPIRGIAIKLK